MTRRQTLTEYAVITTKRSFRILAKDRRTAINRVQMWCDRQTEEPKPRIVDIQEIGEF
jgi:hypothetical protein